MTLGSHRAVGRPRAAYWRSRCLRHAALEALGGLRVATKQVERITEKIGQERVDQRDEAVQEFLGYR